MNEETEMWRDLKEAKKVRRHAALQEFLSIDRSHWQKLTEYHFRRTVGEYVVEYWPNGKKALVRGGVFARRSGGFKVFHPVSPSDVDRFCLNLKKTGKK